MKWFIITTVFFSILFISNSIYSYIFRSVSEVNLNQKNEVYSDSFYDLSALSIDGKDISFKSFKGKKVLIVNVASECGYTDQYDDLQYLHRKYSNRLVILGFPSNNFGKQEPGSNQDIKNFCEAKFGITFPMTEKVSVKGNNAHPFYVWAKENHGKSAIPKWNFHKIIIDKKGKIYTTFSSITSPSSKKFIKIIEELINT